MFPKFPDFPKNCHVSAVTWSEIEGTLKAFNPRMARGLSNLVKASGAADQQIFLAKYRYGQQMFGPKQGEVFSKFLVPCDNVAGEMCKDCLKLTAICSDEPAIGIILSNCVEVYVEVEGARNENTPSVKGENAKFFPPRMVPLRLFGSGHCFGIFEFLDSLRPKRFHTRPPQWRVSCGARNVFFSIPFGAQALAAKIVELATADAKRTYLRTAPSSDLYNDLFDKDNWYVMRTIADHIATTEECGEWTSTILVLPFKWLWSLIYKDKKRVREAKDFLLAAYETGWDQAHHLITGQFQERQSSDILRRARSFVNPLVQHWRSIAQGDLPGFVPYSRWSSAGPFFRIQQFLVKRFAKDLKAFPLILQPAQLNPFLCSMYSRDAVYLSITKPTLPATIQIDSNLNEFGAFQKLHDGLGLIHKSDPELLGTLRWQFFADKVLELNSTASNPETSHFYDLMQNSADVRTDFSDQLRIAEEFKSSWRTQPLCSNRWCFLHQWVRLTHNQKQ